MDAKILSCQGASIFFIVVYSHIARGLLYGSYLYLRRGLWTSGVLILLLMIITAFLGYILPWGQMSLWGATVITNLASTIPLVGENIVQWLWGGFSVDNPTLNKFFSLHYLLPFIILGLVAIHLILLHISGSSNPLGINYQNDKITFSPYYTIKDFYSIFGFIGLLTMLVFFIPNTLGHPDNYIPSNPSITPEHIVPEWYFLPFYAILRAIPDKALGVIALLSSIIILLFLPYIHTTLIRTSSFKPIYKLLINIFIGNSLLLGYLGAKPIESPFLEMAKICTLIYFSFFIIIILTEKIDKICQKIAYKI